MKRLIAEKLFFWAYRLDRDETLFNARMVIGISDALEWAREEMNKPKRGRPFGSKNKPKVEVTTAPKKRGRPFGSKNKPKVPVA